MKKIFRVIISTLIFFFFTPFLLGAVEAAYLKFDKTTASVDINATFQVGVVVDAGSDQISSTDAYVLYDPTILEAQSVSAGSFFPTVANNIASGKVYIAGLVDDPATFKTGSGTVATITFKALKAGSVTLSFYCRTDVNDSSKVVKNDLNATNIIQCTQNGSLSVNVGSSTGTTNNPTPTSTSTSTGQNTPTPSQLPRTGILDNLIKYSVPGAILLLIGGAIRLML